MPVPGSTVFETLQQALAEAREQAAAAATAAKQLDETVADVVHRRSQAFLELARLILPESGFEEVRHDLLTVLERKERRAREIGDRLARLGADVDLARGRLTEAQRQAQEAVERQSRLERELAAALQADQEFQTLSRRALESEAELQRDEERVAEIQREAREKLPAYRTSRLFQYLVEQRYGLAEYRGRGLVKRLDRWVANLVDYPHAVRSYRFLLTTPELMAEETSRRKAEFEQLMQRVEELERQVAGELDLPAAIRDVAQTAAAVERGEAQLSEAEQRMGAVQAELAQLDREQGHFYEEALRRLKTFLEKAQVDLLEVRAAATPDPADDEVALRIRLLGEELSSLEPQVARQKEQSQNAARVSDGLGFVVRRFEQAGFTDIRSFFDDGFDVRGALGLFRAGTLARDALWEEIKRHQERVPTEFEKRASEKITQAMNGPLAGALAEAMLGVAGAALGGGVGRSLDRRRRANDRP
jgi:chromosome segregation ATPase